MSCRHPAYVAVLVLLAIVLSAPQVYLLSARSIERYRFGRILGIPGLGPTIHATPHILSDGEIWNGRIFWVGRQSGGWAFNGVDPVAGAPDIAFTAFNMTSPQLMAFGDRMWIIDWKSGATNAFEIADGKIQTTSIAFPAGVPLRNERLLLNGEPAIINKNTEGKFEISTINAGAWVLTGNVSLPNRDRDWTVGSANVNFQRVTSLTCFNHGQRVHIFVDIDGCVLHREGIDLEPVSSATANTADLDPKADDSSEKPSSAIMPTNLDDPIAGWSLVADAKQFANESRGSLPDPLLHSVALVDGEPVAVFVFDSAPGNKVGHFYRYDGTRWSPFATQEFVFGDVIRTVTGRDERTSTIIASTPLGSANVFELDTNGIRLISSSSRTTHIRRNILPGFVNILGTYLIVFVCAGVVLGLCTWLLMARYTKPSYQYRNQPAILANLRQRAFARLIDVMLMLGPAFGFGYLIMNGFDWNSFGEAVNLGIDHPTIPLVKRVLMLIGLWFIVFVGLSIWLQGHSGFTLGKWSCGLRVLRTTLRPCGFARSLVREIVMSVDTGNLVCWTPGLLSVALSNHRQRLGDLVADTIVVDATSVNTSGAD